MISVANVAKNQKIPNVLYIIVPNKVLGGEGLES